MDATREGQLTDARHVVEYSLQRQQRSKQQLVGYISKVEVDSLAIYMFEVCLIKLRLVEVAEL